MWPTLTVSRTPLIVPLMKKQQAFTASVLLTMISLQTGCLSPLDRTLEQELHEQLVLSQRAYRKAVAEGPVIEINRAPSEVEDYLKKPLEDGTKPIDIADKIGGPGAYDDETLELGADLMGGGASIGVYLKRHRLKKEIEFIQKKAKGERRDASDAEKQEIQKKKDEITKLSAEIKAKETPTFAMSLQRVTELVAKNNMDIRLARLIPAISDTQVTQAEAVFDAVYFANLNFTKTDTPQPPTGGGGLAVFGNTKQDTRGLETGIRKTLSTGGQFSVSTTFNRQERNPSFFNVNTFYESNVLVTMTQPLLRNFGSDVTRSQIALAENAKRESVQDLRSRMLEVLAASEQVYWQLVQSQQRLLILTRLWKTANDERVRLAKRLGFDVTPSTFSEILSREELRRSDMIRARQDVRVASDALKQLLYSKDVPLSGETLIVPLDRPIDMPMKYSILESITAALANRPELRRARLEIKDASIRQRVADNQTLPQLDLTLSTRFNGISTKSVADAYDFMGDGDFVDFIVGLQFEVPIGNRGPQAFLRQREIERKATVINYRRLAQTAVREVKDSMRTIATSYELIGATRAARRAAAENVRTLNVQEDAGEPLNEGFIDLKLRRQETLAQAESQEIQALTDYNIAIARYYESLGTLLERNGIEFDESTVKE